MDWIDRLEDEAIRQQKEVAAKRAAGTHTTIGYMPVMECPACGQRWQWDDYYDMRNGMRRDCPHCDAEVEVSEVETLIHCRLSVVTPNAEVWGRRSAASSGPTRPTCSAAGAATEGENNERS